MRLLFVGSTKFGLRCLQEIERLKDIQVAGAITGKQKFGISYSKKPVKNVLYADFRLFCRQKKIPFYILSKNMQESALQRFISRIRPEFGLVIGWYHLIPRRLLNKFTFAGLHASLLPKYRGGAPLVWAIINGEKEAGISFFVLDSKVDNGSIIGQRKIKIEKEDTIRTLYAKIEVLGIELLKEFLPKIAHSTAIFTEQDESAKTVFPQRSPEDGLIDWSWDASRIKNFIRAQTKPYPGAYTIIQNKKVIIWDADIINLKS